MSTLKQRTIPGKKPEPSFSVTHKSNNTSVAPSTNLDQLLGKLAGSSVKPGARATKSSLGKYPQDVNGTPMARYKHAGLLTSVNKLYHKQTRAKSTTKKPKSNQQSIQYTSTLSPQTSAIRSIMGLSVTSPAGNKTILAKPLKSPMKKEDRSMIVATNSSFFCCGETPTQEFENFLKEDKERMMNEIQAMEKSLPPAELKAKLHEYLKGCFNEIIKADPIYGVVLEKIKISYENLLVENAKKVQEVTGIKDYLVKERRRGDKLEKENIELTKEYEKQCTLIDSQKILIKELKKQVNDSSLEAKGQQKVESLMGEIKTLYKENTKLESTIKKLSFDLKQSKAREATLAKLLKGDSLVATNEFSSIKENGTSFCVPAKVLTESKDLNKTEYKDSTIGKSKPKNKVVVPKLDFSKLPQKKQAQLKVVHCEPCSASSSEENFEQKLKAELGKELMGNEKEEVANEEESENILDQVIDEISSSWRDMLKYK